LLDFCSGVFVMVAVSRAPGGGKKASNLAVGDADIKLARAPDNLIDQVAKDCWKENARILIERSTYSREDAILLLGYCNAFSMMLQCDVELAGVYTVSSATGGLKKHPLINVRNDAVNQLVRLGSLLGLNPMSRARFMGSDKNGPKDGNEFDEF
jgi:P27 family predicted phage terminase small subunit